MGMKNISQGVNFTELGHKSTVRSERADRTERAARFATDLPSYPKESLGLALGTIQFTSLGTPPGSAFKVGVTPCTAPS